MLTKEKFIEFINDIIKQYDATEEVWDEFQRLFGNFDGLASECMGVDLPIKILSDIMNDWEEWIRYFIYECDCGRNKKEIKWYDEEKTLFIETPEQLYNMIIKSHKTAELADATANGFYVPTPEEMKEIYNYVVSNAKDKKENQLTF